MLLVAIVISSLGIITASAQSNLITNPGLESGASQTPTGWSESGANVDASKSETGSPHSGTYKATHWKASAYSVNTFQTKTGLTNGTYTLRAWVMSGGGQTTAVMKAENCGGSTQSINIPTSSTWTQIAISNVNVSNSQCTVTFSSVAAANQWFNFDDVEFFLNGVGPTATRTNTPSGPTPTKTNTPPPGGGLTMRGADTSSLRRALDKGQVYYNASGVAQNPLLILKNIGVNYIRLRIWNNPVSGYNNKAKVLQDALDVKAQGLQLMVDFHYSDTWADPGQQSKPASWNGHNISQLQTDVYNYTLDVCNSLKAQGTPPDSVEIGNEITPGMLFEEGRIVNNDFTNLSLLVKQGYNAIKTCNSATQVVLHTDRGGDNAKARWWYDGMQAKGVSWDITGLSFYCYWHGTNAAMQSNVADLKARYGKPVILAETSYLFTTGNGDSQGNSNNATCSGYAATPAGQASNFHDVQAAAKAGGAIGVFYWEPTWVGTPGNGWDPANINGTGSGWDNQAVFDFNFRLNPGILWIQ
jgi:arabinogalactan endo-1,4-beta-galactosidase